MDGNSIGLASNKDSKQTAPKKHQYEVVNTDYVNDFHDEILTKKKGAKDAVSFLSSNNAPTLTEYNSKGHQKDNTYIYNNSIINTEPTKTDSNNISAGKYNKFILKDNNDKYIKRPIGVDIKKEILTMNQQTKKPNINNFFNNVSCSFDHNNDERNITYENLKNVAVKTEIKKKL